MDEKQKIKLVWRNSVVYAYILAASSWRSVTSLLRCGSNFLGLHFQSHKKHKQDGHAIIWNGMFTAATAFHELVAHINY